MISGRNNYIHMEENAGTLVPEAEYYGMQLLILCLRYPLLAPTSSYLDAKALANKPNLRTIYR